MKYRPQHYAKAFSRAIAAHPREKEKLIKNFTNLIKKNRDMRQGAKILAATEKFLRPITGAASVAFTTARPVSESVKKLFYRLLKAHDVVRESIDPSLIGGVKIVVNDETQFDGTLKRKLDKIFSNEQFPIFNFQRTPQRHDENSLKIEN